MKTKEKLYSVRIKVAKSPQDWGVLWITLESENRLYTVNKNYCAKWGIVVGRSYDVTFTLKEVNGHKNIDKIKWVK
jgi:hypothetical protein